MSNEWKKDYPRVMTINEETLDSNNSLKKMLSLIGENKRVVDFGCASGYFAQLLTKRGCIVTGVELNPEAAKIAETACKEVVVADLDFVSVKDILPTEEFDVAIFGDVLEHLRNPWKVLQETKQILKKNGYVVASIPNIAHGAIRLALLQGKFEYMDLGILDNTHLRFFTKKTVQELFDKSGYIVNAIDRTTLNIFSDSHLTPKIHQEDFNQDIIQQIESDEEAHTLQFLIRAIPSTLEERYILLNQQYSQQAEEIKLLHRKLKETDIVQAHLQSQLHNAQAELQNSQSQLQETQVELQNSQSQLQDTQAELQNSQSQLQDTQAELQNSQSQLQDAQAKIQNSQLHLEHLQIELQNSQSQFKQSQAQIEQNNFEVQTLKNRIKAMESSKFWNTRTVFFKVKKVFGMKGD